MNKLARLWDKFLTWLWWPAVKKATRVDIESAWWDKRKWDKKNRGE